MHKTLVQNFGRAHYDLVGVEMVVPYILCPQVTLHGSAETVNAMVEVSFQDCKLLENEGYRRNLWVDPNQHNREKRFKQAYQEKGDTAWLALAAVLELLVDDMP